MLLHHYLRYIIVVIIVVTSLNAVHRNAKIHVLATWGVVVEVQGASYESLVLLIDCPSLALSLILEQMLRVALFWALFLPCLP